jgi:hypothetical protein
MDDIPTEFDEMLDRVRGEHCLAEDLAKSLEKLLDNYAEGGK